jgi:hypothetical protein
LKSKGNSQEKDRKSIGEASEKHTKCIGKAQKNQRTSIGKACANHRQSIKRQGQPIETNRRRIRKALWKAKNKLSKVIRKT